MKWASLDGGRIEATPRTVAACPICGGQVVAKCGEIVSWHWAHKTKDCDQWSEPESEWHRKWKSRFPAEWQECKMGRHRADVVTPIGIVEFQRSFLSTADIRERETFYPRLIWVVDAGRWSLTRQKQKPIRHLSADRHGKWTAEYVNDCTVQYFEWKRPRQSWIRATRPVYLDIGAGCNHLFLMEDIETKGKTMIESRRIRKSDFLAMCHGIPSRLPPLLTERSSFDWYGEALQRRATLAEESQKRRHGYLTELPLFAPAEVPA